MSEVAEETATEATTEAATLREHCKVLAFALGPFVDLPENPTDAQILEAARQTQRNMNTDVSAEPDGASPLCECGQPAVTEHGYGPSILVCKQWPECQSKSEGPLYTCIGCQGKTVVLEDPPYCCPECRAEDEMKKDKQYVKPSGGRVVGSAEGSSIGPNITPEQAREVVDRAKAARELEFPGLEDHAVNWMGPANTPPFKQQMDLEKARALVSREDYERAGREAYAELAEYTHQLESTLKAIRNVLDAHQAKND